MKNVFLYLLCILTLNFANAQETSMQFYAGPTFEIGLSAQTNVSIGGTLGFTDENYFLGLFGTNTFYDKVYIKDVEYQKTLNLGGVVIGFTLPSEDRANLFGSLKLGWGAAYLSDNYDLGGRSQTDAVFAINPEIGLEVKVTSWYRFAITASYRLVEGINDLGYLGNYDFENYGVGVTFRFGSFTY